jgi:hypothetical protein
MSAAVLFALIRDTFRQGLASGIFWLMLAVTAVCTLFCLSVGVSGAVQLDRTTGEAQFLPATDVMAADPELAKKAGVDVVRGEVTLGFGAVRVQLGRDARDVVHFIVVVLGGGIAGAAGVLLMLIWTSGFLPSFLEPSNVAVLLAKPVPRWLLLLGKFLGLLVFVLVQASLFVLCTWFTLGIKTGEWVNVYLWSIPLVLLQFSVFASVSILLAVLTRSVVICIFGSILFWFTCWGINYGRHAMLLLPELQNLRPVAELPEQERVTLGFAMRVLTVGSSLAAAPAGPNLDLLREVSASVQTMQAATRLAQPRPRTSLLTEAGYWLMPKPADLNMVFFDVLNAHQFYAEALDLRRIRQMQRDADQAGRREFWYRPSWSVITSLLFNLLVLGLAMREFNKIDY